MNKTILFISIFFIVFSITAQNKYTAGYYVNASGNEVSGFIKNEQWSTNPTEIAFRSSEESVAENISMDEIQSFEISGIAKFIKANVSLDSEKEKHTVLLNVLSDGKASLYMYTTNEDRLFFYQVNQYPIELLVNKKPFLDGTLKETNAYQQQLLETLRGCKNVSPQKIKNLRYKQNPLAKVFDQFNACSNVESVSYLQKGQQSDFNLNVKLGVGIVSFEVEGNGSSAGDYGDQTVIKGEIEAEYVLPFNKNKWSIFIGIGKGSNYSNTIVSSTSSSVNPTEEKTFTYKQGFEAPIGIRHYLYLANQIKLSLHAGYNLNYINEIGIEKDATGGSFTKENKVAGNLILGAAFHYSRIFVEARFDVGKDLVRQTTSGIASNNNVASLSLGYQFL